MRIFRNIKKYNLANLYNKKVNSIVSKYTIYDTYKQNIKKSRIKLDFLF